MTTAFVLAGGGSLGAVEVGMLTALSEHDVRPDLVVGSSVGAVNGVWTAFRPDAPDELASLWKSLSRNDVFPFRPLRALLGVLGLSDHLVPSTAFRRLLERNLPERLEDTTIPVHVTATNLLSGADALLSSGNAVEAVLASTAVPGVFPPVTRDGEVLVDGGTVNNTPVSQAVALGADVVWVLPTGYACDLPKAPRSALGVALQALTLAINHRLRLDVERYRDVVDLRVVPSLCPLDTSPADFSHAAELIERAHEQTLDWLNTDMSPLSAHPHE